MSVALVVRSDRGDLYLPKCLAALDAMWPYHPKPIIVDDRDHKLGMAGAVREGWSRAIDTGADYIFEWEEDFRPLAPVPIDGMLYVLDRCPELAQVVLKRQAWSDEEKTAGGIVELHPESYVDHHSLRNVTWATHRRIFSLNPCLIPRRVAEMGWPDGNEAEFTQMCADAGLSFAFYGSKFAFPVVEHIGSVRASGYRL